MRRYSREWPAASCGADPGRSGAGRSPPVPADISGSRHAALPSGAVRGQPGNQWSPAAGLGLTPSQYSSGGKSMLGRITKAGDSYLRTLLVPLFLTVVHAETVNTGVDIPGKPLYCNNFRYSN